MPLEHTMHTVAPAKTHLSRSINAHDDFQTDHLDAALAGSRLRTPGIDTMLTYNILAISARRSGWDIERIMAFCRTIHVGV